jgi:hypothetical protein
MRNLLKFHKKNQVSVNFCIKPVPISTLFCLLTPNNQFHNYGPESFGANPLLKEFNCIRNPSRQTDSVPDRSEYLLLYPQGADSLPPPLRVAKTGKNQLNVEIGTPLLPTWIGDRFSQTISNFGHAALLRQCELPL